MEKHDSESLDLSLSCCFILFNLLQVSAAVSPAAFVGLWVRQDVSIGQNCFLLGICQGNVTPVKNWQNYCGQRSLMEKVFIFI